jgi:hypothetical protein
MGLCGRRRGAAVKKKKARTEYIMTPAPETITELDME